MERVAAPLRSMGAADPHARGAAARRDPRRRARCARIQYPLPVASAQVKSALLLAGLSADGRTRLTEPAPSRDHTERMLRAFGVAGSQARAQRSRSRVARRCAARTIEVPGDFSSAAFFLVAGCLAAERPWCSRNVGINPTRTGLLEILQHMGADIRVHRPPAAGDDGEPVADLEVRAQRPARHHVPAGARAAGDR